MYLPKRILDSLQDRAMRVEQAAEGSTNLLPVQIESLVEYINSVPTMNAIIQELGYTPSPSDNSASDFWIKKLDDDLSHGDVRHDRKHYAGRGWHVLNVLVDNPRRRLDLRDHLRVSPTFATKLVRFCVDPLVQTIKDTCESGTLIEDLLLRYKHRTENFNNDDLFQAIKNAQPRTVERKLSNDLYRYLFDQGVDFRVEPSESAGRPDFVPESSSADETWVGEVKAYAGKSPSTSELEKNISQIRAYLNGAKPTIGFLVVFNCLASTHELEFASDYPQSRSAHCRAGNKDIAIIVVELRDPQGPTASKGLRNIVKVGCGGDSRDD